jgi:hypothetical protein
MQISGGAGKETNGKQALTRFQRICTDGTHSIVLCKPVTGRTHQVYLLSEFCTLHCLEYANGQMHLTVERHYLPLGLDISEKLEDIVHGMLCSHISNFMIKSICKIFFIHPAPTIAQMIFFFSVRLYVRNLVLPIHNSLKTYCTFQ